MKYNLILFLLINLFLVSCTKKTNPPEEIFIPVSDEFKKNWYFKAGSYWIYKDSISKRVDSAYISSTTTQIVSQDSSGKIINIEVINLLFNSPNLFTIFKLTSYPRNLIKTVNESTGLDYLIFDSDTTKIVNIKAGSSGIKYNQIQANLKIGSFIYPSVRAIYYSYTYPQHSLPDYTFSGKIRWQKEVGIVKFESSPYLRSNPNPRNLELLRFKIVK